MSKLAVLKSIDPLFASLFSALLLGENILKPTYLAAIVLIITAVYVSNYVSKTKKGKIVSPNQMGYFVGKFVSHRKGAAAVLPVLPDGKVTRRKILALKKF